MGDRDNNVCSVHVTGATIFVVVAPQHEDIERSEAIFSEVRNTLSNICRSNPEKRIRLSLIAPSGDINVWESYNFVAPKIKALRLDFKDHNISFSVQRLGDSMGILDRALCQGLCLTMGVSWGGCLSKSSFQ